MVPWWLGQWFFVAAGGQNHDGSMEQNLFWGKVGKVQELKLWLVDFFFSNDSILLHQF